MPNKRIAAERSPPNLLTLVCVAGLGGITMNMFLPSLPSMAKYFSAPAAVMQLTISVYLAASAVLQLVIGPLSDRFGRRNVMLNCLVFFLLGTLICIAANSVELLILGRIIQASSVAGMVLSRAIVRDLYKPEEAASMIAYVTMGMAIGPMIAPVIGGMLDELYGWQASFMLMLALGIIVLIIAYIDMGETNKTEYTSFRDQFRQYPELFRSRRFWGYVVTAAFSSGAFFALLGGGPFVATEVLHLTPTRYGLYFGCVAIGYILGNFASGRMSARLGLLKMIFIGSLTVMFGLLICIGLLNLGFTHPAAVFGPMFFVGFGNGMVLPNTSAGIVSVRPKLAGTASGLGGSLQIGGGAIISALAGTLVSAHGTASVLFIVMLVSALLAVCSALYVGYVDYLIKTGKSA
ncbi:MAG: multidrug effflux MFS transporter [Rhizobiaceae bacterium]